jgi:hypothetical protein
VPAARVMLTVPSDAEALGVPRGGLGVASKHQKRSRASCHWGRVGRITEINWKQIEKPLFGCIMDALLDQILWQSRWLRSIGEGRRLRVPRLKLGA